MKILIILILNCVLLNQSFGACEHEREMRDKSRDLCDTLGKISGFAAAVGGIHCLAPASSAKRACDVAEKKEKILQYCEQKYAYEQSQIDAKAKDEFYRENARLTGKIVSKIFMQCLNRSEELCAQETEEIIDAYICSGRDITDPRVRSELEFKIKEVERKYL